jgi:hypothetical protein
MSAAVMLLPNHSCALSWTMMKSNLGLMPTPVQSRSRTVVEEGAEWTGV